MKLIDVSVPLDANAARPTPATRRSASKPIKRIARGDSSNVSTLHMSAHTGTHVDAPRHFFDDGAGRRALPLEMLMRPRARHRDRRRATASTPDDLARARPVGRRARADQDAQLAAVGLAGVPPRLRRRHRVGRASIWSSTASRCVGVDYLSVEEFKKPGAPAHHVLLGAGTIVIEGLNLRDVEPGIYEMFCLPLRDRRRRRRAGARRPAQELTPPCRRCSTTASSSCSPAAPASGSIR